MDSSEVCSVFSACFPARIKTAKKLSDAHGYKISTSLQIQHTTGQILPLFAPVL